MTTSENITRQETIELSPNYTIPLVLIIAAIPLLFINAWISVIISLFGLFLMFQTLIIRLKFTPTALDVYRTKTLIRSFPYSEWQNWRIYWKKFPVLFYFKEVKSIHFLPILFDAKKLENCLEKNCPFQ